MTREKAEDVAKDLTAKGYATRVLGSANPHGFTVEVVGTDWPAAADSAETDTGRLLAVLRLALHSLHTDGPASAAAVLNTHGRAALLARYR